jgi:hypothetical protein
VPKIEHRDSREIVLKDCSRRKVEALTNNELANPEHMRKTIRYSNQLCFCRALGVQFLLDALGEDSSTAYGVRIDSKRSIDVSQQHEVFVWLDDDAFVFSSVEIFDHLDELVPVLFSRSFYTRG